MVADTTTELLPTKREQAKGWALLALIAITVLGIPIGFIAYLRAQNYDLLMHVETAKCIDGSLMLEYRVKELPPIRIVEQTTQVSNGDVSSGGSTTTGELGMIDALMHLFESGDYSSTTGFGINPNTIEWHIKEGDSIQLLKGQERLLCRYWVDASDGSPGEEYTLVLRVEEP